MRRLATLIVLPLLFLIVALSAVGLLSALGERAFGDWRLVFVAWERSGRLITLIVFSVLAVGCIGMLFSYEQKLVSRRLGYTLLSLRLLLILTLFLTLLEPVWTWSFEEEHRGRVLVALDLSESMDTQDKAATDAEKLHWARALGMVGNEEHAQRIEQWLSAYERGEEPLWVTPEETNDPGKRAQLTQVRKENMAGVFKQLEGLSRKEILKRLMMAEPNPLAARLGTVVEPEFCLFAGEVEVTPVSELSALMDAPDELLMRGRTDVTQPLIAGAGGREDLPLVGIIVFSDGRDNVHATPQQFASRLAGSAVPIHTVLIGSERRPKDLAIINVDYPDKVFEDDDPVIHATVRTSGFTGEKLQVRLEGAAGTEFATLTEEVTPTGDVAEVSFKLSDLPEGRHRFKLLTEVRPGETRDDNNDREFALEVVDDRANILLLEGEGRWEFRYIDAALRRDERIELDTVLFDQPYLGVLPKPFYPRSLGELQAAADNNPTPFSKYDAVLIGDVRMVQINLPLWEQLDRYVREEGGTLILTAGKQGFPRSNTFAVVQDLLPVENLRELNLTDAAQLSPPDRRGFHLELTPDGALQPMFQLDADPIKNERIWENLPGHTWGLIGEAKKTASVWAAIPPQNGEEIGLAGERKRAIVAQHYVGTGQVVWIGIDSTWRWRFRVGDQYHHRFWGQLARWSVEFKASSGNQYVRFGVNKPVISTGEQIVLRTQWDERFLRQNPNIKVRASLTRRNSQDPPITLDLTPLEGREFVFEGRQTAMQDGDYVARLEVTGVPLDDVIEAEFSVTNTLSPELQDVSANRDLLEQTAQLTGGKFFLPDQMAELPELFRDIRQTVDVREEVPVWNHWLVLVIFCLFATSEWVLRKINGLP